MKNGAPNCCSMAEDQIRAYYVLISGDSVYFHAQMQYVSVENQRQGSISFRVQGERFEPILKHLCSHPFVFAEGVTPGRQCKILVTSPFGWYRGCQFMCQPLRNNITPSVIMMHVKPWEKDLIKQYEACKLLTYCGEFVHNSATYWSIKQDMDNLPQLLVPYNSPVRRKTTQISRDLTIFYAYMMLLL
uniref:Uncharacterized protein n=1 Tax=Romanomermis culicivorax TaxID=13658 RepID=A0A915HPG3_ROMCU